MKIIAIRGAILVKIENFIPENALFQGCFTEVSLDTSGQNQLSFFSNFFDEPQNQVKCR
jgi:hypothetical protein